MPGNTHIDDDLASVVRYALLLQKFKRQLDDAADGVCPDCAGQSY
jgi:hypothetical protein